MKKHIIIILASMFAMNANADTKGLNGPTRAGLVTPAFQNPIHAESLADANPQYTVKASGRYYFAGNISAANTTSASSVILVDANNVTLNMNNKNIVPHPASTVTNMTALQISAGKANVQVMNGTIYGEDNNGTPRFAKGVEVKTTGTVNYSLKLNNVHVALLRDNSGTSIGFDINGVNDLTMNNCSSNDATIVSASGAKILYGASLNTVNNTNMNNCEFNNNAATSSDAASALNGLRLSTCVDGNFNNVVSSNNSSTASTAGFDSTVYGINLQTANNNLVFKNSKASLNTSTPGATASGGAMSGFRVAGSSHLNSFIDCAANSNTESVEAANPTGFEVASGDNCVFTRCEASQNSSSLLTSAAYGFKFSSDTHQITDCSANGNSSTGDGDNAYGFYFTGSSENRVSNCVANANASVDSCYGFYLTTSSDNNRVLNCHAAGNSSSASAGSAIGFYANANTANSFEGCTGSNQNASHTTSACIAAGFELAGAETRSQVLDCESTGNLVGDGTTSSTNARSYGIFLSANTSGAENNVIKNCYVAYNAVSSSGLKFGIYDNNDLSTSLLINNLSVGHGKCLGGLLNDSLNWGSVDMASDSEPLVSQNYFFHHAGTGDDPRYVIQEAPILNFLSISTTVGDWTNISIY